MVAIPGYDRVVIRQAAVADTVNPQAIQAAAAGWNTVAQVADVGAQVDMKIREEDDKATLNEILITREREKIDLRVAEQKKYEATPEGFSKNFEAMMQKKDAEIMASLPARLQQSYKMTISRSNLSDYEQNKGWETERRVAVVGDKIGRAAKEITSLAYTYGASGKPFEELTPNIDATMMAGSGVLAPEKLSKFDDELRADSAMQYLAGLQSRDPQAAQDLLNSGKLSKFMTADQQVKASKAIWEVTPDLLKLEQIKNSKQPLSVRNNNPGNIRGEDGAFKKFATPEEGQKAMADDLRVKITGKSSAMKGKFGDNYQPTLSNLIHTWAPTNENDTTAYINTVAKETGIAAEQKLTTADIPKLQAAMIKVEGGQSAANYFATGTAFDGLPYGEKVNEVEKISKAIADDPAKAAMQYGADTPQAIVQVQAGLGIKPQDARVLTNFQAQEFATKINASQDSNAVLQAYAELKSDYQDFTDNAIQDLVSTGKLKPEMNAALGLVSGPEPQKYREQIDLLGAMAKTTEAAIKEDFKVRGYDEASLLSSLPNKYQDLQRAMLYEDPNNAQVINQQAGIVLNLARMKMVKDGSSYGAAMEFATKAVFDSYDVGEINGVPVRIPLGNSVGIIEDETEAFINEKIPTLINPSQSKDYIFDKDFVQPSLNQAKDGLVFFAPRVGAITDKDGKPLEVSFKQLIGDKKPRAQFTPKFTGPAV